MYLSPISVWETLVLARKKRIVLSGDPETWVRTALKKAKFREAPLNYEVALLSEQLQGDNADPADRFLAATAMIYDLTLVTADRRLIDTRQWRVLPN
jgi:PIN domain nuclease of toxin-antitoxin system